MGLLISRHPWTRRLTAAVLAMLVLGLLGCNLFGNNADEVRQPTGNVEDFWNQFTWDELTSAEQSLWQVLGWDEASWNGTAVPPASESELWSQLSESERAAATDLGYSQQTWDAA